MNEKVHALINQQINTEFYSAYLYLNFSNYFEEVGLDGFANWYKIQAQEELEEAEIEGESGSGLVKVVVNGKKVVKSLSIDPKAVDPDDIEMLEDLIVAALNTAYEAADEMYEEKMGKFGGAGGLI